MRLLLSISFFIFLFSCNPKTIAPELIGKWTSHKTNITLRYETKFLKYDYISDTAEILLRIYKNNMVSGSVGVAEFFNGKIKKNISNVDSEGMFYIVKCGYLGRFFDNDPFEKKEVEILLKPVNDSIYGELRLSEVLPKFTMATFFFAKDTAKDVPVVNEYLE